MTEQDRQDQLEQMRNGGVGRSITQPAAGPAPAPGEQSPYDKFVAQQKAMGLNPDGSPLRPDFKSITDVDTGQLKDSYQLKSGTLTPEKLQWDKSDNGTLDPTKGAGYQAFQNEALRTGPSQWAQLQQQQNSQNKMQGLESAARQASSGAAQARGQLSMRGGLSSGARERMASGGARDLLAARQGVNRGFNADSLTTNINDENKRMNALAQLPGMEIDTQKYNIGNILDMKKANVQAVNDAQRFNITNQNAASQYNINNALGQKQAQDQYTSGAYDQDLQKWAAAQQSAAIANGAKKPGGGGPLGALGSGVGAVFGGVPGAILGGGGGGGK